MSFADKSEAGFVACLWGFVSIDNGWTTDRMDLSFGIGALLLRLVAVMVAIPIALTTGTELAATGSSQNSLARESARNNAGC